uniref:Cytochrome C-type biogenesis protein n=1 Tax=Galdieria sulphuraria TaxID=130081 RepID=A0A075W3V5_GALSU|nr:cytochrome C-type biogenesis protein [Galdieria sulphuraria]AIG92645.1 cytochrome C-type biogenesis protein [Galdieria sulphuraria]
MWWMIVGGVYGRGSIMEEIGKEGIRKGMGIGSIWSSVEGVGVIVIIGMVIISVVRRRSYRRDREVIGMVMVGSRGIIGRKEEEERVEEVKKQLREEKEWWHPVMMLMGYMIQSMGNRVGDVRRRKSREKSMLVVSVGIIIGGRWSMEIEGWGGYWNWDGVEKVSMIVWMMIVSGIHSGRSSGINRVEWSMSMYMSEKIGKGGIESIHSFVERKGVREEWAWWMMCKRRIEGEVGSKELSKMMIVGIMVMVSIGGEGMKSMMVGMMMVKGGEGVVVGMIGGGEGYEGRVRGGMMEIVKEGGIHGIIGVGMMMVIGGERRKEVEEMVNVEVSESGVWKGEKRKRSIMKEEIKGEVEIREWSEIRMEEEIVMIVVCMVVHWSNLKWYRCIRWR